MTNSSAEIMDAPPLGLNNPDIQHKEKAIGFFQALYIPVFKNSIEAVIKFIHSY